MTENLPAARQRLVTTSPEKRGAAVIRSRPIPSTWWAIITRAAKAGTPYHDVVLDITFAQLDDPTLPGWPDAFYDFDEGLPRVSLAEGIAVLERVAVFEGGQLTPGLEIRLLEWEALTAHYFPRRERYQVLRELVSAGLLEEPPLDEGTRSVHTHVRFPLRLTKNGATEIRRARLDARLPTARRIENKVAEIREAFPNLTKVLLWAVLGGGLVKLADLLISFIDRS